jgi:hypothetical protein
LIKVFIIRISVSIIIGFSLITIISKFIDMPDNSPVTIGSGVLCALFYAGSGFFSYYYAYKLKPQSFIRFFLFSMVGRFVLVIIFILLVIKFSSINTNVFIVSFFVWYFVFQILEIIQLNQIMTRKV